MKRYGAFPVAVLFFSFVFFTIFLFGVVLGGKDSVSHTGYLSNSGGSTGGSSYLAPGSGGTGVGAEGGGSSSSPPGDVSVPSGMGAQATTTDDSAGSGRSSSGGSGSYESRTRTGASSDSNLDSSAGESNMASSGSGQRNNDVYASPDVVQGSVQGSGSSTGSYVNSGGSVTILSKQQVVAAVAPDIQNKYNLDPSRTEVQAIGEDFAVSKVIVKSSKKVHFFGVIPVYMPVEVVKSLDDSSENVNRPWWAYFVSSN